MKAKKKPLDIIDINTLGINIQAQHTLVTTEPPKPRAKGVVVSDVKELVHALRQKGLVA
jgi:electron transfer flavoprotein beta subunit